MPDDRSPWELLNSLMKSSRLEVPGNIDFSEWTEITLKFNDDHTRYHAELMEYIDTKAVGGTGPYIGEGETLEEAIRILHRKHQDGDMNPW